MDRRYIKKMEAYWAREYKKTVRYINSLEFETWFDYWHTHPDWKAKGNRDNETKEWVAKITYDLLKVVEDKMQPNHDRLQAWATICEDSGDNAIYIHSENPNGTPYPYDFHGVIWGKEIDEMLLRIIDTTTHDIGKATYDDEIVYYIRRRA